MLLAALLTACLAAALRVLRGADMSV